MVPWCLKCETEECESEATGVVDDVVIAIFVIGGGGGGGGGGALKGLISKISSTEDYTSGYASVCFVRGEERERV